MVHLSRVLNMDKVLAHNMGKDQVHNTDKAHSMDKVQDSIAVLKDQVNTAPDLHTVKADNTTVVHSMVKAEVSTAAVPSLAVPLSMGHSVMISMELVPAMDKAPVNTVRVCSIVRDSIPVSMEQE